MIRIDEICQKFSFQDKEASTFKNDISILYNQYITDQKNDIEPNQETVSLLQDKIFTYFKEKVQEGPLTLDDKCLLEVNTDYLSTFLITHHISSLLLSSKHPQLSPISSEFFTHLNYEKITLDGITAVYLDSVRRRSHQNKQLESKS